MATIQGLTKARMLAIEAASIVSARLSGSSLILTKFNGTDINVGSVIGPAGPTGAPGPAVPNLSGVWGTAPLDDFGAVASSTLGQVIYNDTNGQLRAQPQIIDSTVLLTNADVLSKYPLGVSIYTLTTAQATAGAWPVPNSGTLITIVRGDAITAVQYYIRNTSLTTQMTSLWRVFGTTWQPWQREIFTADTPADGMVPVYRNASGAFKMEPVSTTLKIYRQDPIQTYVSGWAVGDGNNYWATYGPWVFFRIYYERTGADIGAASHGNITNVNVSSAMRSTIPDLISDSPLGHGPLGEYAGHYITGGATPQLAVGTATPNRGMVQGAKFYASGWAMSLSGTTVDPA